MRCAIWYYLYNLKNVKTHGYFSGFLDCTKLPNRATHHNKCSGIYKDVTKTADLTTFLDWDEVGSPFHATCLFLHPLKISKKWFSDVFRVYRKRPVG